MTKRRLSFTSLLIFFNFYANAITPCPPKPSAWGGPSDGWILVATVVDVDPINGSVTLDPTNIIIIEGKIVPNEKSPARTLSLVTPCWRYPQDQEKSWKSKRVRFYGMNINDGTSNYSGYFSAEPSSNE